MAGREEKPRWKRLVYVFVISCFAAILIVTVYQMAIFEPSDKALVSLMSGGGVKVSSTSQWWLLEPDVRARRGPAVIFYPGLLAEAAGYSPWARQLAEQGYPVYLVKMPLNLSILAPDRATRIMQAHPDESFVIGGHSLGGAVAARYAAKHRAQVNGLILVASFVDKEAGSRLAGLPVMQLAATKDGIISLQLSDQERDQLPPAAEYVNIRGGNHQQFASFAEDWRDNPATITESEQHRLTADALIGWLSRIGDTTLQKK